MSKWIAIFTLLCMLLTGCKAHQTADPTENSTNPNSPSNSVPAATDPTVLPTVPPTTAPTTVPTTPATEPTVVPQDVTFAVYYPDADFIAMEHKTVTLDALDANAIMQELIAAGFLHEDVRVNSISVEGSHIALDLNDAFLAQLYTMGSTGEYFLIGSVVNTFLSAYGAETILITSDGAIMESGHAVYDFPLNFMG